MEGGDKHERQKREKEILPRERERERKAWLVIITPLELYVHYLGHDRLLYVP